MADHPKMTDDRKKASKSSDPTDSDGSHQGDIECDTCGIAFSDGKAYENHMQGKKHQRKVAEAKLVAKSLASDKKKQEQDKSDEDDDDDEEEELECDVCDKTFTGYLSYLTHMKGKLHAKNVRQQKLKKQLDGRPEVLNHDDQGSEDDSILPMVYARCDACQKEFSGPEPYKMHLRSAAHKKKVRVAKVAEDLKKKDDGEGSDDDEAFAKCHACRKSFSGVVPYKIHMESAAHKKSLEKKRVAEELKEYFVEDESNPGFVCKECKKCFSDPVAFKCHLENNSHEKQKAKSALLEFLNEHPEIVMTYPLEEAEKDGSEEDDSSSFFLICKLCQASFSGPESAKDHVKSKRHVSLKKEKRLKKQVKEQQQQQSGKARSKGSDPDKPQKKSNGDVPPTAKAVSANGSSANGDSAENHADDFEMI